MAIDNKKLAILIIIGLIAFSLFASSGESLFKKSEDYDMDGIPNLDDPHPNRAHWTDWFGYVGAEGQDLIFGILLFILLAFIFWFAAGSVFRKISGGAPNDIAMAGIAVALAGAATIYSYGTPVWQWWRGLFTASPFIILVIVIIMAIMVGAIHFLKVGKQVQKELKGYRKERRAGLKEREKIRAARKMAGLQKVASERIEHLAKEIISLEKNAYAALLKIKNLIVMASRAKKGAQKTYYQQIMKEVAIGAKIGFRMQTYANRIEGFQKRLEKYLNKEIFEDKTLVELSKQEVGLAGIETHLNQDDKRKAIFNKHNIKVTAEVETKLASKDTAIQRKIRAYAQDIRKREQWRRQAYKESETLVGEIRTLVNQFNTEYGTLRGNLKKGKIGNASVSVNKAIAIIRELNPLVKQLDKLEDQEEEQDMAVLKEENIEMHLENVVYRDVIREIQLAKKK